MGIPLTDDLTERQEAILDCIRETVDAFGEAPSLREIGRYVGLSSIGSVAYQLGEMERKGFLVRDRHMARAIRLL
jgi:repressor LexA